MPPRSHRRAVAAPLALLAAFVGACAAPPSASRDPLPLRPTAPRPERPTADIIATLNGVPIRGEELEPFIREAAGATILREVILDRLLDAELNRRGIRITPDDLAAERRRLDEAVASGAGLDDPYALREALRQRRGLGPARLDATVRRSAGLRKLVSDGVSVSDADLALAERVRFGPRHVLRVIETPTAARAAEARSLVVGRDIADFARIATERSIDTTAPAGGLIGPVSLDDPAYPQALRDAARKLPVGGVSEVIGLDSSFVVVRVDAINPPRGGPGPGERDAMRAELRHRKERVAMEAAAEALLARASVSVLDDSIGWNWTNSF